MRRLISYTETDVLIIAIAVKMGTVTLAVHSHCLSSEVIICYPLEKNKLLGRFVTDTPRRLSAWHVIPCMGLQISAGQ